MRNAGVLAIGRFQTPMEKEYLRLQLRGRQPVVVCTARGINYMLVSHDWRTLLKEDRLLIFSPFPATHCRPTVALASQRNQLVTDLAYRSSSPIPLPAARYSPSPAGSLPPTSRY